VLIDLYPVPLLPELVRHLPVPKTASREIRYPGMSLSGTFRNYAGLLQRRYKQTFI